jgi:hypothetical protein
VGLGGNNVGRRERGWGARVPGQPVTPPRVWWPVVGLAVIGHSGVVLAVAVAVLGVSDSQCDDWVSRLGRRESGTRIRGVRLTRPMEY